MLTMKTFIATSLLYILIDIIVDVNILYHNTSMSSIFNIVIFGIYLTHLLYFLIRNRDILFDVGFQLYMITTIILSIGTLFSNIPILIYAGFVSIDMMYNPLYIIVIMIVKIVCKVIYGKIYDYRIKQMLI